MQADVEDPHLRDEGVAHDEDLDINLRPRAARNAGDNDRLGALHRGALGPRPHAPIQFLRQPPLLKKETDVELYLRRFQAYADTMEPRRITWFIC